MICVKCNSEMVLDDVDITSKNYKDNYYICENCYNGCIEEIRPDKENKIIWIED